MKNGPYVFLDIDGVMTEFGGEVGSYVTHDIDKYGISEKPYKLLVELLADTGAKVVISSNWRKFDETGAWSIWRHPVYGDIRNPLPKLKSMLKNKWLCDLPPVRHAPKALALDIWFEDNGIDPENCKYVVFDDDDREGFAESRFKDHFVRTDCRVGLTRENCEKAKELLTR